MMQQAPSHPHLSPKISIQICKTSLNPTIQNPRPYSSLSNHLTSSACSPLKSPSNTSPLKKS